MTAVVAPKSWLPPFVMRYSAFPGWMMKLPKRQNGSLNHWVILFRLQYETHSLQMHPKFPCRSVVFPTSKLLERRYAHRLVVVSCQYLPSLSLSFQLIMPSLLSHISSVAVPHILHRRIHPCFFAYPSPCFSAAVFTSDLVCHPYYSAYPPHLHCYPPASLLQYLLHYLPSFHVLRWRCLSTFSDRIFSLLYVVLYYTACSSLLHTTFFTIRSDLITALFFSLLERLFSISVMFLLRSNLPRF